MFFEEDNFSLIIIFFFKKLYFLIESYKGYVINGIGIEENFYNNFVFNKGVFLGRGELSLLLIFLMY